MSGVAEREQAADRDRLDLLPGQRAQLHPQIGFVERCHYLSAGVDPLDYFDSKRAGDQRRRIVDVEIIDAGLRTLDPADVQHVAKAPRGQQQTFRQPTLDHRVGRERGGVMQGGDGPAGRHQKREALDDGINRVVIIRRRLGGGHQARRLVQHHEIGEGAADVDARAQAQESYPGATRSNRRSNPGHSRLLGGSG